MYFLTRLTHTIKNVSGQFEVLQLVKAIDKYEARAAVIREALKELREEDILQVRVNDTLIGE